MVRDEDWYSFDDRGLELHSKNPKVPGFQSLLYKPKGWKYGKAIIGFVQCESATKACQPMPPHPPLCAVRTLCCLAMLLSRSTASMLTF